MIVDLSQFLIFLSATVLLNLIPGADVMYIASQSLHHKKQGVFAALGISTGIGIYIIATMSGLAAILKTSVIVFNCIKYLGAAYLLYLAWQSFRSPALDIKIPTSNVRNNFISYRKGIFTTLSNPKVGLFFLTFLPQFVDTSRGNETLQLLTLGGCFILSGTIINLMYVFLFSYLRKYFFSKNYIKRWLNKITAFLFCALAFKMLSVQQ